MARVIPLDKPLSDEDEKYLRSRGRFADIERNRKKFADAKSSKSQQDSKKAEEKPAPKPEGAQKFSLDQDIFEKVKAFTHEDLNVEFAKAGLDAPSTVREMRVVLAQHLQNERNKGSG